MTAKRDIWVSGDGRLLYGREELRVLRESGEEEITADELHVVSVDDAWRAYATLLSTGWRPPDEVTGEPGQPVDHQPSEDRDAGQGNGTG